MFVFVIIVKLVSYHGKPKLSIVRHHIASAHLTKVVHASVDLGRQTPASGALVLALTGIPSQQHVQYYMDGTLPV